MNIVVLTGAGISAESGLPTFRGAGGLWEGHRVEEVATPQAFSRDPAMVHRFYNERRQKLAEVEPNAGHKALVELEEGHRDEFMLITQNVDDLHERAGSQRLLHLHGELRKARCVHCGLTPSWVDDLAVSTVCPDCQKKGGMRPHIVWFGEMPFHLAEIESLLRSADLFLAIGTSAQVYPAAGFVEVARAGGARTIEVNLVSTDKSGSFERCIEGPAGEVLPPLVEAILAGDA